MFTRATPAANLTTNAKIVLSKRRRTLITPGSPGPFPPLALFGRLMATIHFRPLVTSPKMMPPRTPVLPAQLQSHTATTCRYVTNTATAIETVTEAETETEIEIETEAETAAETETETETTAKADPITAEVSHFPFPNFWLRLAPILLLPILFKPTFFFPKG